MKKFLMFMTALMISVSLYAENLTNDSVLTKQLSEYTVTSFYRQLLTQGSVIDTEKIANENYGQDPSWMLSKMPSVFAFSDNGTEFGYGYFRIRGFDQTLVNVTLDGMPWNEAEDFGCYFANSPNILGDAHSVSLIRGTSTYYSGSASYGGSINIESVDLKSDTVSSVELGAGSFGTYKQSVTYNSGLMGKWAIHARATQSYTDGYRNHSHNTSQSFGLKVGYFINDKSSIDFLSILGRHDNGQGYIGSTLEELSVNRKDNGCSEYEDDNFLQSVNKLQYTNWFNDKVLFTSSLYFNVLDGAYRFDLDNFVSKMEGEELETGIVYNYGLKHYLYGGNAASRFYLGNTTLTLGTNIYKFEREHYLDDRNVTKARNVDASEYYDNRGHKMDAEFFVNTKETIGNFTLSANMQYRYVNFWYTDLMDPSVKYNEDTKWNMFNFGANAEYKFNKHSELYLKYARAHREPTRTDMFGGNEYYDGLLYVKDLQVSNDIEFGWNFANKKVNLNANFYAMLFENELVLSGMLGENGLPIHINADNSHRIGFEFFADYEPWSGWHLINNTSLSNNKVKSELTGTKTHVLTPNCTFVQDVEYRAKKWSCGVEYKYRSSMYLDGENEYTVPSSWQFNLYGKYKVGMCTLSAHMNNVTNRNNYQTGVVGANGVARYMVDTPTSIYGQVTFNF